MKHVGLCLILSVWLLGFSVQAEEILSPCPPDGTPEQQKARSQADDYNLQGLELLNQENPEEAIKRFQRAVEIIDDYADAYLNYGIALQILNRHEEALLQFDKAIRFRPKWSAPVLQKAESLIRLEKLPEAEKLYLEVLKIDPKQFDVTKKLIGLYREKGDIGNMKKMMQAVRDKQPGNLEAIWMYANEIEIYDPKEALEIYLKVKDQKPNEVLVRLAYVYMRLKQYDLAKEYAEAAIRKFPEDNEAYLYLTEIYIGLDNLSKAWDTLQKVESFDDSEEDVQFLRFLLLVKNGNMDNVNVEMNRLMRSNPCENNWLRELVRGYTFTGATLDEKAFFRQAAEQCKVFKAELLKLQGKNNPRNNQSFPRDEPQDTPKDKPVP